MRGSKLNRAGTLSGLLAGVSILAMCATAHAEGNKWTPWIELGGAGSTERHRGEITAFAPLLQSRKSLLFTDLRGKLFERGAVEGNFALGVRHTHNNKVNLGAWVGVDIRETEFDNRFTQGAAGIEALWESFDFRVNGYAPFDNKADAGTGVTSIGRISGGTLLLDTTTTTVTERALWGVDAEIGMRFPLNKIGGWAVDKHEFWLHGGGFYFDNGSLEELTGPMARATYRVNDVLPQISGSRLSFRVEYKYDDVRDSQVEGVVRLRLPFGPKKMTSRYASLSRLEKRMNERLERDTDVVATASRETISVTENAVDANTGQAITTVATVDGTGNLNATAAGAGANSIVVVDGSAGAVNTTATNGVTMAANQTLLGGGSTLTVRGASTGELGTFTAPGTRPTITSTALFPVVTIADASRVQGVTIVGNGLINSNNNRGIEGGNNLTNVNIEDVLVRDVGYDGIFFSNNNQVTLRNVTFQDVRDGLDFDDNNTVIVDNVTILRARRTGIDMQAGNNVTITNSSISELIDVPPVDPSHAIFITGNNNTVSINNTTFGGRLDEDILHISGGVTGTTLSGEGNTIDAGATLLGDVCDANAGTFSGSVEIGGTTFTSANCP